MSNPAMEEILKMMVKLKIPINRENFLSITLSEEPPDAEAMAELNEFFEEESGEFLQ